MASTPIPDRHPHPNLLGERSDGGVVPFLLGERSDGGAEQKRRRAWLGGVPLDSSVLLLRLSGRGFLALGSAIAGLARNPPGGLLVGCGGWGRRPLQSKMTPGLRMFSGSNACLMRRMRSILVGSSMAAR